MIIVDSNIKAMKRVYMINANRFSCFKYYRKWAFQIKKLFINLVLDCKADLNDTSSGHILSLSQLLNA